MKNLLKRIFNPQTETEVIEEIHDRFNLAGERLLREAKEIIAKLSIGNDAKVKTLSDFGFRNTSEVKGYQEAQIKKSTAETLAKTLCELSVTYPGLKFITTEETALICEKYNLVLGSVEQYTGFVPDKNVREISSFYTNYHDLTTKYFRLYSGWRMRDRIFISKGEYNDYYASVRARTGSSYEYNPQRDDVHYGSENVSLRIAAPLKDMKKEGYTLVGRIFKKDIPDPVVLAPISMNGLEFFAIVTAWGAEASDPIIQNEKLN